MSLPANVNVAALTSISSALVNYVVPLRLCSSLTNWIRTQCLVEEQPNEQDLRTSTPQSWCKGLVKASTMQQPTISWPLVPPLCATTLHRRQLDHAPAYPNGHRLKQVVPLAAW